MHWAEAGAYTGEISAIMLAASGVDLVMLGHAERRTLFRRDGCSVVQESRRRSWNAGLRVLLCVGEQAGEREVGISRETVAIQLKTALFDVDDSVITSQRDQLLVAYEPVWSIGEGGTPATPSTVEAMQGWIREVLMQKFGAVGQHVPLLYGGSVNQSNCANYAALSHVDGLFVGRAAWSPQGFVEVMRKAASQGSQRLEIGN